MNAQLKPIGLTEKEGQIFSVSKLMRAMIDQEWGMRNAGFELAACEETAKQFQVSRSGFYLPPDIQQRALTATGGGASLVQATINEEWYAHSLTAAAVTTRLGATVLTSSDSVAIPRVQPGTTEAAVAENAAGSEVDQTFQLLTYTPKTITSNVVVSRRLLAVTGNFAETVVRNDVVEAMAANVDFYAIQGTGAGGAPTGLLNTAGLVTSSLGTNGGAPTYTSLIDVERQVTQRNGIAQKPTMGWATNTKGRATMRGVSKQTNWGFLWDDAPQPEYDGWIMGYPAAVSNNVPNNLVKGTSGATLSALIFGNWADLFIVQFGPVAILVDPYSFSNTGAVRYNVFQEVDIQPRRTDSFCAIVDMIAT